MNEDNLAPVQENSGPNTSTEEEFGARPSQIFDISTDDIKPFREETAPNAPPVPKKYITSITPLPPKGPILPTPSHPPELNPDFAGLPPTPKLVNLISKEPPRPTSSMPPINPPIVHASVQNPPTLPKSPAFQEPRAVPPPPVVPNPTPEPMAAPKPRISDIPQDPNIKPLRTYENDVAEVLARQRESATSIALAESRRREGSETIGVPEEPAEPRTHGFRNFIIVLFCFVMIGGGAFAAYYFYLNSPLAPISTPSSVKQPVVSSIIPIDSRASIIVDGLGKNQIMSRINEEISHSQADLSIKEIILATAKNSTLLRVASADMMKQFGIEPPDVLFRSLTPEWMLGVYALPSGDKSVFVIVTTDFFQNTFSGLLQWEKVMADDLKEYLYPIAPTGVANIPDSTAIATSSSPASKVPNTSPGTTSGKFEDKIVHNKDVRAFRTTDGNILFLYSFLDNRKLIITNNEATLNEVLDRLEKQAFVR